MFDDVKKKDHWLVATPVHWIATHNDAMITACNSSLKLSEEDSRRFFTAIAADAACSGVVMRYHDPYSWFIRAPGHPPINAKSAESLLHQSLMPTLQLLDTTFFWQRYLTECQMFLSTHSLNKERILVPTINGIWIWQEHWCIRLWRKIKHDY